MREKGMKSLKRSATSDHIHMLVKIPPKYSIAEIVGYLKGKSALMIFDRHANLKYRYGNRHFWCRGYYVDTVGKNEKKIAEYVREQLQDDIANDQISLKGIHSAERKLKSKSGFLGSTCGDFQCVLRRLQVRHL